MVGNERLQRWALISEIVGGLAILITLVFLLVEVRANTRALEHESFVRRGENIYQSFVEPARLPGIYARVKATDGLDRSVEALMNPYELTVEEAAIWSRHLGAIWRGFEADFLFYGPSESLQFVVRGLLSAPDQQIYWDATTSSRSEDFVAYVESIREGM